MRSDTEQSAVQADLTLREAACPACGHGEASVFFDLPEVPVHCNVLCATRDEALAVPRGDIRLAFCRSCGFIWNLNFEPARMAYGGRYENSLHFSARFQQYAEGLAARLIDTYGLRGKRIIEIACGQGDFLRMLCRMGNNQGVGFDPGYVPGSDQGQPDERVRFVVDYYSEQYAGQPADLICCRHALEHMADPLAFLRMVRRNLAGHAQAVLYFEVPNALFTLRQNGFWDILYEHCTYFTPVSLEGLFKQAGLRVVAIREEYDGQFLAIEARCGREPADEETEDGYEEEGGSAAPSTDRDAREIDRLSLDVRSFGSRYRSELKAWRDRLELLRARGQRVITWGSGSKGTMFLNALRGCGGIEHVVDINARKQGMFVPGSGQRIVPPEGLRTLRPDVVVVMNPIYEKEVQQQVHEMDLRLQVVSA